MTFKEQVIKLIQSIPQGKVASYGQIAAAAGSPRAARQVGGILRACEITVPWWRVINSQGIISIKGNWTATKDRQAELLRAEKIVVSPDYSVDIENYRHIFKRED